MGSTTSQTLANRSGIASKIVLGFITTITTAVIGFAGVAAAQSNNDSGSGNTTVSYCKEHYQQLGYKNVGDCVSHNNGHGHGYGGSGDNDGDEQGNNHFHFHNFFGGWWHHWQHFEHRYF